MPYANRDGIPVHYRVEGNRPWLVLAHGLSLDHRAWRELGYVDALAGDYRLVVIDARGHGRSGRPKRPAAYRSSRRVADVVAVLDDLAIDRVQTQNGPGVLYPLGGGPKGVGELSECQHNTI